MPAADDLTLLLQTSHGWSEVAVTGHDTGMNSRIWWVDLTGLDSDAGNLKSFADARGELVQ